MTAPDIYQPSARTLQPLPGVPAPLAALSRLLPGAPPAWLAPRLLDRMFAAERECGALDFLTDRQVLLRVSDLDLSLPLGYRGRRFRRADPRRQPVHLRLEGPLYGFLLLAARREDPDTLFFQRQLRLSGDTELGLELKNFLDGLDDSPARQRLATVAEQMLGVADRLCGKQGGSD